MTAPEKMNNDASNQSIRAVLWSVGVEMVVMNNADERLWDAIRSRRDILKTAAMVQRSAFQIAHEIQSIWDLHAKTTQNMSVAK